MHWHFENVAAHEVEKAHAWEYGRQVIQCDEAHAAALACVKWQLDNPKLIFPDEAPFAYAWCDSVKECRIFGYPTLLPFVAGTAKKIGKPFGKSGQRLARAVFDAIDLMLPWQWEVKVEWHQSVNIDNPEDGLPANSDLKKSPTRNLAMAERRGPVLEWMTGVRYMDELRAMAANDGTLAGFIQEYENLRKGFGNREKAVEYGCFAINWNGSQKEIVAEFARWVDAGMKARNQSWRSAQRPLVQQRRALKELGSLRCKRYYGRAELEAWLDFGGGVTEGLCAVTPVKNINTLDEYASAAEERLAKMRRQLIPLWQLIASSV